MELAKGNQIISVCVISAGMAMIVRKIVVATIILHALKAIRFVKSAKIIRWASFASIADREVMETLLKKLGMYSRGVISISSIQN